MPKRNFGGKLAMDDEDRALLLSYIGAEMPPFTVPPVMVSWSFNNRVGCQCANLFSPSEI